MEKTPAKPSSSCNNNPSQPDSKFKRHVPVKKRQLLDDFSESKNRNNKPVNMNLSREAKDQISFSAFTKVQNMNGYKLN